MLTYKQGFKVVHKSRGKLESAVVGSGWSAAAVQYFVGRWVKPKDGCGPLCVFDSFYYATDFANSMINAGTLFVYRCRYGLSHEKHAHTNGIPATGLPVDTKLASKVYLIDRVK